MPADISLFLDSQRSTPLPVVALGEVIAPESGADLAEGEPIQVYGRNSGTTNLRGMSVHLDGEGGGLVQLARDIDGEPGVWAAPGESIIIDEGTLFRDAEFSFWARGVYSVETAEGRMPVILRFKALSIG